MSKSYQNFVTDLERNKSPVTKAIYTTRFKELMAGLGITHADAFLTFPKTEFEDKVKMYIDKKVADGKGYSFLNQTVSAVRLFCIANRIDLNFIWLFAKVPKPDTASTEGTAYYKDEKPYNKGQIELLNRAANKDKKRKDRLKLEMGIMYSGGARLGALPTLRIEYSVYVEKYDLIATKAYPQTKAEYWIVLTPTVSKLFFKVIGKEKKGFVLTNSRNTDGDQLSAQTIKGDMLDLTIAAGIRQKHQASEIKLDHGFRKFHSTACEKAGLRDQQIAHLRGTKERLAKIYQLPPPIEVIENNNYAQAIPFLTVDL